MLFLPASFWLRSQNFALSSVTYEQLSYLLTRYDTSVPLKLQLRKGHELHFPWFQICLCKG